jgi:hypothetical protein
MCAVAKICDVAWSPQGIRRRVVEDPGAGAPRGTGLLVRTASRHRRSHPSQSFRRRRRAVEPASSLQAMCRSEEGEGRGTRSSTKEGITMTRRVPMYSIPCAGVGDLLPAWRREHRRRAEFTFLEGIDVVLVTTHPPRANENQNNRSADEQEREQHREFPSTPSYPSDQIAERAWQRERAGLSSRGRPASSCPGARAFARGPRAGRALVRPETSGSFEGDRGPRRSRRERQERAQGAHDPQGAEPRPEGAGGQY